MSRVPSKAAKRRARRLARNDDNRELLELVERDFQPSKRPRERQVDLKPLTKHQADFDKAIFSSTITFGVGPAGTGKTWWAAMRAAEEFKARRIDRIIVTRPAVEAGESLGFLPGELEEKYEPYFRPVRDALVESLGAGHLEYLMKTGAIEARPLGLLRGATIKNAWLIADEMQNASVSQMKLLLTRIGENAKVIINGDVTQCDLPKHVSSGLADATRRLERVNGVSVIRFDVDDVVRSGICRDVILAYSDESPDAERYNNDHDELSGLTRFLR